MGTDKRMDDALFARIFPFACEYLGGGIPLIMQELIRARESELSLLAEVGRLRVVLAASKEEGAS